MRHGQIGMAVLHWACGILLLVSCSNELGVTVLYDPPAGLKPGDPVHWQDQQIGTVGAVSVNKQGRVAVAVKIQPAFRANVTDQCRFVLMKKGIQPGHYAIDLTCLTADGTPLPNGAEVEGLTTWGLLLEQGRQGLQAWSKRLQTDLERWQQTLKQLPLEAWAKELEQRMTYWTRELEQAGEETQRFFKQEVLPALEAAINNLKQQLPPQEQDKTQKLERQLEELKRI
jgi:ABC-type transporter Mla subunit MlaD